MEKVVKRLFDLVLALILFIPASLILLCGVIFVKIVSPESLPIFNELFVYLHEIEGQYLPKGKMGSAISYTFHKEEYLRNFFKDGRCELSNNLAEQRIKPFVIARKNFLF